jgi:hypothetical protein
LAFPRCLFMCNIKGPTCATNNFKWASEACVCTQLVQKCV